MVEVNDTDLRPGDVLFFRAGNWLLRRFLKYGHVALFLDRTKRGLPLVVESIGRGVLIRSLFCYTGEEIVVKRPVDDGFGAPAAKAAERLADNPGSWYGYFDIPRFALPKLILAKVGHILPAEWGLSLWLLARSYHRNSFYICSEMVASAYRDAGYPLVDEKTIPLPDDLFHSLKLRLIGTVKVEGGG